MERIIEVPATNLRELLAPVHDFTEVRAISEEEVEQFFNEQLNESRRERQRCDE